MPSDAENVLINAMTDVEMLEALYNLKLPGECIPTPELAKIVDWACEYFLHSGCNQAPGRLELTATWGSVLEAMGAELESEDVQQPRVAWAVGYLKAQYARAQMQGLLLDTANSVAAADITNITDVVARSAARMATLASVVSSTPGPQNGAEGLLASVARMEQRRDYPNTNPGFGLGLPAIDAHTGGIKRGELGTVISPKKSGKSFLADWAVYSHFNVGGNVVLFTLENTSFSMYDRLACIAAQIDYTEFQRGEADAASVEYLKDWISTHRAALAERVMIVRPDEAGSTAEAMCAFARSRRADAIVLDQLSHIAIGARVRLQNERERTTQRHVELVNALHGDGSWPLSGLLLAQASRAAAEQAEKTGTLGDTGGAESSAVERSPDLLWGLHQSADDAQVGEAKLELLLFRRGPTTTWRLEWRPWRGHVRVIPELGRGGY